MRTRTGLFVLVLMSLVSSYAGAAPVQLRVTDQAGAPFPDVLVIVKSLAGKGEIFRALSGPTGRVPERNLPPGLYRVIATCPYGICETSISEFLADSTSLELEVKVDISPSRGNVAFVGPSNRLKLEVVDIQGKPAVSAEVLVRDSNAEYEQWYKTNGEGKADVEPRGKMTTFVVVYNRTLTTETISSEAIQKLRSEGKELVVRLK
jgi:hypothetical protein